MVDRGELALPDYDQLPTGSLQHRVRSLTLDQVEQLLDYERGHGDREGVKQVLAARLTELDAGAQPSPGSQETRPESPGPPRRGSPVGPNTAGPPANPPPHGDPAQPARPKADRQ